MKKSKEETDKEFLKLAEFLGEKKDVLKEDNPNYIWCDICEAYIYIDDIDWRNDTSLCPICKTKINL